MKATPFDPGLDLPPLPFEAGHCDLAARLKAAGLPWRPHAGCFVWDRDGRISVPSPFPQRIYFILNLGRFLEIFGTLEEIQARLVWLPTWHQARLLAAARGIPPAAVAALWQRKPDLAPGEELLGLYTLLLQTFAAG